MLDQSDIEKIGQEVGKIIEDNINPQFDGLRKGVDGLRKGVDGLRKDVDGLRKDVDEIKSTMVTQSVFGLRIDALEDRLIDMMQSEDRKLAALVQILLKKNVLDESDVTELLSMPPFARKSA